MEPTRAEVMDLALKTYDQGYRDGLRFAATVLSTAASCSLKDHPGTASLLEDISILLSDEANANTEPASIK